MSFRQYMEQAGVRAVEAFPEELRPEIYAVSFRIDHAEQDIRYPYLAIDYNTETTVRWESREPGGVDAETARWHYAHFALADRGGVIGHDPHDPPRDPDGAAVHEAEVKGLGLWFEDVEEEHLEDGDGAVFERLGAHFDDAVFHLARHLHTSGRLAAALGRPVPVVVFDMDRRGFEAAATAAVNPPDLVSAFLTWGERHWS
ncbi:hypothetical protein CLV63_102364 [Murinocardiopsis flavida]|uniref:Uncharacterized protein n=1 Tax=Murinocardiopsis flavida TaxID=645275 RepID=A0A2P8DSP7_9ACTN|nr:hypothetical protein [Murinocardiopsis flavida]PSL00237.1 hypothetical protein CLV63_102364 [Murinocardiopsis flavida]